MTAVALGPLTVTRPTSAGRHVEAPPRRRRPIELAGLAPLQAFYALGRDRFEVGVQLDEQVPKAPPRTLAEGVDNQLLQVRVAAAFPDGVGQRDQQLLQRAHHSGPLRMRSAATRQRWIDTLGQQELFARGLMLCAAPAQLLGVKDLARIVKDRAAPDEVSVMSNAQLLEAHDKEIGGLTDKARVHDEPRRGAESHEEIKRLDCLHAPSGLRRL